MLNSKEFDPKNLFSGYGLYVIVEKNTSVDLSLTQIIGVALSYNDALAYTNDPNLITVGNRTIVGPVPLVPGQGSSSLPISEKIHIPMFKKEFYIKKDYIFPDFKEPSLFETATPGVVQPSKGLYPYPSEQNSVDKDYEFGPFTPRSEDWYSLSQESKKAFNDFSMSTPPPSRMGSASTSPSGPVNEILNNKINLF